MMSKTKPIKKISGKEALVIRDTANTYNVGMAFLTAGGEVLQRDFDLSQEQAAAWAMATMKEASRLLGVDK